MSEFDAQKLRLPTPAEDAVEGLRAAIAMVGGFASSVFSHPNWLDALVKKLEATIGQVQRGETAGASDKLRHDLSPRPSAVPRPARPTRTTGS